MAQLKQVSTLFHLLIIALSAQAVQPDVEKQAGKQALENNKDEFTIQINETIDESVKTLAETNDSKLGIANIRDLKKQPEELNGTEVNDTLANQNNTRRRDKKSGKKLHKEVFDDVLLMKAVHSQKHKDRLENRNKMKVRVEDWLKKKKHLQSSSSISSESE
ncbi:hypothetical protein O0L34_g15234 [Tuta absoluta]|nr:hypothetical protein O0L34_g15234 [Tuta absoluta]